MDREALTKSLLVFAGAGVGANARFWLGTWLQSRLGGYFPWGTFAINMTGSLGIGLAMGWLLHSPSPSHLRMLVIVGLLGGYTTFSGFSWETLSLIDEKKYLLAGAYVVGSCLLGLLAAWIGLLIAKALSGG